MNLGLFSRGVRFIDPIKAARQPETWLRLFEAAVDHQCEVLGGCADRHPAERVAVRRRGFFPDARVARRAAALPEAARRAVRAAVGDARLRTARPDVSRVPGHFVARGPRLLSQVHRRRAHAADDPESRTAGERLSAGPRAVRLACSRNSRSRSCWCCRCCSTTSASGRTKITRPRACGWPIT